MDWALLKDESSNHIGVEKQVVVQGGVLCEQATLTIFRITAIQLSNPSHSKVTPTDADKYSETT